jgi:mono/diheme cytochrome c family protein
MYRIKSTLMLVAVLGGCLGGVAAEYEPLPASLEQIEYGRHVKAFLGEYCLDCHDNETQKADLNLEKFGDAPELYKSRRTWEAVRDMIEHREMPPSKKPQPSEADRKQMVLFIEKELAKFDCEGPVNPGRVTIRRLNRAEYNNTIRDLMGVDFKPAEDFPLDEVGYGFDNIGDVLSLPPMLLEKYLLAAEKIVTAAIVTEPSTLLPRVKLPGKDFRLLAENQDVRIEEGILSFYREGGATVELAPPTAGEYILRLRSFGDLAGPELPRLSVKVGGRELAVVEVSAQEGQAADYDVPVKLEPGTQALTLAFLNNFNTAGDRNVYVEHVELLGPTDTELVYPAGHARIIPRSPKPGEETRLAREQLGQFASRAWRRPATDDEVNRLAKFVTMGMAAGGSFEQGMQLALQAVLVSPQFLFRWELDPRDQAGAARQLTDYELASRLSYFVWSSLPDDELTALAAANQLRQPEVLAAQLKRMLADPKAWGLVENFAGQWLQVRSLDITPDPDLFPTFDEPLRRAMQQETLLFFQAVMLEDLSLAALLNADFTFVNERLARHYGIPGVKGDDFQRVKLPPEQHRGGILTQGSILALTSNPTRTSPVNRGKWILEQILGTPPPPPPPNVPELEGAPGVDATASLRIRTEQHRANPDCATCHEKMDPLGFAFENFDAIGGWRDRDGEHPIDPSGKLPDGREFKGPGELKQMLMQGDNFARTVTEKMLTFALGRGLEYYDKCAVDEIVAALKRNDLRFSTLILEVIKSRPFQMRQPTENET